jgi:SWIM zinc finger
MKPAHRQLSQRETKALEITVQNKLTRKGQLWFVPSQSGSKTYTVNPDPESPRCTCPDFEFRQARCKHIYAVEYTMLWRERMRLIQGTRGRWFATELRLKNGALRRMVCRYGVRKGIRGIWPPKRHPFMSGLAVVWDVAQRDYRTITLASMISLRCGSLIWHG